MSAAWPAIQVAWKEKKATGCEWTDACPCTCGECVVRCAEPYRFEVERSDHDESFMATAVSWPRACDKHLADTICWLLEGRDDLTAIVTVRWDHGVPG